MMDGMVIPCGNFLKAKFSVHQKIFRPSKKFVNGCQILDGFWNDFLRCSADFIASFSSHFIKLTSKSFLL